MELLPFVEDLRVVGTLGSNVDIVRIERWSSSLKYYLCTYPEKCLEVEPSRIPPSWKLFAPYIHGYTILDEDAFVEDLAKALRNSLEGKTLVLGFSGGKDSTALLVLATKLVQYVNAELLPIYVHVPILDTSKNLSFVDYVSKKLGIEIVVVEAKRRDVLSKLRWLGMPRRGFRWCTAFKVVPMRRIVKERNAIELLGDRVFESLKRLKRLLPIAGKSVVYARKLHLLAFATFLDIHRIVRRYGLVHPSYLEGSLRVSCTLCPYRTLFEIDLRNHDDPGLIEELLRRDYSKRFSRIVDLETFLNLSLWRFDPSRTARILRLVKSVEERCREHGCEEIAWSWIKQRIAELWSVDIDAPYLGIDKVVDMLRNSTSSLPT